MDIKKILFKTNSFDAEKALPDATVYCNKEGKIQWVNDKAAEIFETSRMHLLTSDINDFIENALGLVKNSLNSTSEVITKTVSREQYFNMTTKELDDGYVLAFRIAVNYEQQPKELSEDEAKIVNRDKNNFIVKLANDFKSPLQSIVGFSQAMADGLGGEMTEQQEKYIKIIKKNSSDLMYFMSKLIDLSQTEVETKLPEYRRFDLISSLNSILRFNEQLYKDKEIRWNLSIEEGLKNTIVSDENIIKTVIQNILEVVLKSVDMGEILVSVSNLSEEFIISKNLPQKEYIMISISSSALMLSENDLESMFDPYKIVDSSNRKNLLRAIMLACVKNSVQSLQGLVWVESKILKNTSFNIIIPNN